MFIWGYPRTNVLKTFIIPCLEMDIASGIARFGSVDVSIATGIMMYKFASMRVLPEDYPYEGNQAPMC